VKLFARILSCVVILSVVAGCVTSRGEIGLGEIDLRSPEQIKAMSDRPANYPTELRTGVSVPIPIVTDLLNAIGGVLKELASIDGRFRLFWFSWNIENKEGKS